ncbi:MAG: TolC family protein [Planctomycetia bacterium]|nr:TolC family protein [Planctomycetia bacterium]
MAAESLPVKRLPPVNDLRVHAAEFVDSRHHEPTIRGAAVANTARPTAVPTAYQEEIPGPGRVPPGTPPKTLPERLEIPPELPGANVPLLVLPPEQDRKLAVIDILFPDLPVIPKLAAPPAEQRLSLVALEQLAIDNSPVIAQVRADITVAMGQAIQAGVYPNPVLGYEADTVGSAGTRNYQGVFGTQVIKTAGKVGLARSVANVGLMNAQLAFRRARIDLMARVKKDYYSVLVAQESLALNDALVRFTNEVYRIQGEKLKAGLVPLYEPAQLRSLAVQARNALVQAQIGYVAAWKAMAVTVGVPGLPMAKLDDDAEMPVPKLSYEAALARMLNVHPDVQAARNTLGQARLQRRLAQVTPVPDVNVYGTFQRDFTTPNVPRTTYNIQLGVPLPLWDRNRGNIISAQSNEIKSAEGIRRAEYDLTAQLADAFSRFETSRISLQYYREQILPDLARSYRGIYQRYQQEGEKGTVLFGDIIVAQQNLTSAIAVYLTTLDAQWKAVADLARLLQVETINELNIPSPDVPAGAHPPGAAGP